MIGLTTFRFEDYCRALIESERSVLLSHAHLALLRCLIGPEAEGLDDELEWALLDEFTCVIPNMFVFLW